MTHTVEIAFEDSHILFHSRSEIKPFLSPEAAGRFDTVKRISNESQVMPELAFASPAYENGSLLWASSASDALLLRAIHRAEGYSAELLWDNAGRGPEEIYVVLTSWDSREMGGLLTDEVSIIEFFYEGSSQDQSMEVASSELRSILSAHHNLEIMGQPTEDQHDDHYHINMVVKMVGSELLGLLESASQRVPGAYGYNVISPSA